MSATETTPEGTNPLRILLIVLAALVVLAALWFLVLSPLLGGDEAGDDEISIDRPGVAEEPVTPDPDAAPDEVLALPIETYEVFLSRDPFEPVIPAFDGGTDGGSGDGTGTDGGGSDGGGTDGGGTDGGGTDGGGTDGGTDGGAVTGAAVIDVFVDDQGQTRALIRVGDLLYTVGEGDVFDDDYLVVSIDDPCVTLQQNGETFTLCEGGSTGGGGGGPGGGGADGCSGSDEVVCDGRVVSLVDVFTDTDGVDRAVVQVDATLYEVVTGDTFAQNFRVMSIDPPCVTLLFGDDAFTLCEGDRVLK